MFNVFALLERPRKTPMDAFTSPGLLFAERKTFESHQEFLPKLPKIKAVKAPEMK